MHAPLIATIPEFSLLDAHLFLNTYHPRASCLALANKSRDFSDIQTIATLRRVHHCLCWTSSFVSSNRLMTIHMWHHGDISRKTPFFYLLKSKGWRLGCNTVKAGDVSCNSRFSFLRKKSKKARASGKKGNTTCWQAIRGRVGRRSRGKMKKIASGITLVLLISMLLLSGSSHSTESASLASVEKAINFLVHIQFNQSLGLCRESHLAPNVYWLVSDNLWAWKALKMANMHAWGLLWKNQIVLQISEMHWRR